MIKYSSVKREGAPSLVCSGGWAGTEVLGQFQWLSAWIKVNQGEWARLAGKFWRQFNGWIQGPQLGMDQGKSSQRGQCRLLNLHPAALDGYSIKVNQGRSRQTLKGR